ncbi:class I SAM-dependent methyltransferase [Coleofasciculus sp. FACHB-SPT9]|uniref:class I SAM-dependent methyltransferase n=1 Tax=Cyanophyceae TaxID=3028117 RepID=UPI001688497D|nr:class I SAM-dependent methyltransferase [Coleofasciculus sp. FACHB-SPT9]MBD1889616.1 methyltransferase domain-containing protein [Coleofasciculus sp. FACHB-SPT9]
MTREELDFGNYIHRTGAVNTSNQSEPFEDSPVIPLFSEEKLEEAVVTLRKILEKDDFPQTKEALKGEIARRIQSFCPHWFQRIDYPNHNITSTSNHNWAFIDEGGVNTLGKKLTSQEASILRPWPKWLYIKDILPNVVGKSILELGSSNGFFSFRFAELGASHVTGVEIIQRQYESAVWSADILGHKNVSFINTDALLDLTIPKHDIVFLSEVHNHFLFPFFGLLRVINLAKEMVIFDTGAVDINEHRLDLHSGWKSQSGNLVYHSFQMTDGLIMDFLNLVGIPPYKVKRYKAPSDHYHILYAIDTTEIEQNRQKIGYPEYLRQIVELKFKTPTNLR